MKRVVFVVLGIMLLMGIVTISQVPLSTASATHDKEVVAGTCGVGRSQVAGASKSTAEAPNGLLFGRCQDAFCWSDGLQCQNIAGTCTNGVGSCSYELVEVSLTVCPAPDPLPPCYSSCG